MSLKQYILYLLLFFFFFDIFYINYNYIGLGLMIYLIYDIKKIYLFFDINAVYITLFSFNYSLFFILNDNIISVNILTRTLLPVVIYLIGMSMGRNLKKENEVISFFFFISFAISIKYILSYILHIQEFGTLGMGITRSMKIIATPESSTGRSATGIASHLSPLLVFIPYMLFNENNLTFVKKIFYFIYSAFGLILLASLASRTPFVITAIISFVIVISQLRKLSIKNILTLGVSLIIVIYSFINIDFESIDFTSNLVSRMDDKTMTTAGSRTERWSKGFEMLFSDPTGIAYNSNIAHTWYAHNLWLDTSRVSGWFAMIPLLFVTLSSISMIIKTWFSRNISLNIKLFSGSLFLVLILQFFTEPVMEGAFLLVLFFFLFLGFFKSYLFEKGLI